MRRTLVGTSHLYTITRDLLFVGGENMTDTRMKGDHDGNGTENLSV